MHQTPCFEASSKEFMKELSVDKFVSFVTTHYADCVFEHHILLEKVVYRHLIFRIVVHRALEEEAEESLDTISSGPLSHIAEQHEVKTERCCKD